MTITQFNKIKRLWRALRHDRRGATAVLFAVMLPALLATGPLFVDIGYLGYRQLLLRQTVHASALAAEISRQTGKPRDLSALRRVKATRSQVGLSRAQRAENVQGAFRIADGAVVRDLNVVLVDDVLTSGATANAASRALLRAGAKRVDVLVFARVVTAA